MLPHEESESIEFKEAMPNTKELAKDIVAFANTKGGLIYLGIKDKTAQVVGIHITPKLKDRITDISSNCDPPVDIELEEQTYDNKTILVIKVADGSDKPYFTHGQCFRRVGATSRKLSKDELFRFGIETGVIIFEQQIVRNAKLEDIDEAAVRKYIETARLERNMDIDVNEGVASVLKKLDVLVAEGDSLKINNAGILFFGKTPHHFLPQSEIRAARFQGKDKQNFIDMEVITGRLPEMIDEAMKFVRRNTRVGVKIDAEKRVDIPEYPYRAIEEAITNAVTHRDYSIYGASIFVNIFDDRIEVESPGKLPPPLTLETFENRSVLRNRIIGRLLFNIKKIEAWGTGIVRMKRLMKEHGLKEPEFKESEVSLTVVFWGPGERLLPIEAEREFGLELNERQKKALEYIKEHGSITNREYRRLFKISYTWANKELNELISKRIIKQIGKGRSTKYTFSYQQSNT